MLRLSDLLEAAQAELARRRAVPPEPLPPAIPERVRNMMERKYRADQYRERDREARRHHQKLGLCLYLKCRGEHCPGGYKNGSP